MKLAGRLPKDDMNGLDARLKQFLDEPDTIQVALVMLKTSKVTKDVDAGGSLEPTLKILRVEAILPEDAKDAKKMLRRALEKRLGVTVLPLELEDEISAVFDDAATDRETGEQHTDGK
jgi:hypothetical protein